MGNICRIIGYQKRALTGSILLTMLLCVLMPLTVQAGVPTVSSPHTTDIATRSFAVTLTVSEPSSAVLSLFTADCTTSATGFSTSLQDDAASGNMLFKVSGLTAGTSYCYSITATSASTLDPITTAATPVVTASSVERTTSMPPETLPSGNDILRTPAVHLQAGESRSSILSTVELVNGSAVSPLSLLLSSDPDKDYFNLNNLFAAATGKTLDVAGGERVRISENHGSSGCVIERYRIIPADAGGTAARLFTRANPHDIDASGGVNILDVLRLVGGKGSSTTGPCFNSDLDLNGDGLIDIADVTVIKGGFNGLP